MNSWSSCLSWLSGATGVHLYSLLVQCWEANPGPLHTGWVLDQPSCIPCVCPVKSYLVPWVGASFCLLDVTYSCLCLWIGFISSNAPLSDEPWGTNLALKEQTAAIVNLHIVWPGVAQSVFLVCVSSSLLIIYPSFVCSYCFLTAFWNFILVCVYL